ncbi:hypothetical protein M2118_000583 [Aurantimicrobium minutum]|uniref:GmrSD restriction endonuclease domain-containing protein n=1 Tax=Aurantimicrobium minutum TaxID=708131 RepID=UPI0024732F4E|nr:DUF262 domain-containing protein [Aurantimicrobium minutum]MDH6277620.1 hypothetical protein [Aurantimicrobium minutum]
MLTDVRTPHDIFFTPQRLLVPLFQRPYVWSKEGQWAPLWEDVKRVADKVVLGQQPVPHFLGAVVLQQQPSVIGNLAVRTVIDGQQRLTTLQLLIDAAHASVQVKGFEAIAKQLEALVENAEYFTQEPEEKFKVWPTNRDRAAFNEVMSAELPIDYSSLSNVNSRMVEAHSFFYGQINDWLGTDDTLEVRANALVLTIRTLLQIVVIDLLADEDAQEIFETLNARGTPLTAADLIKNFVFQRLETTPKGAEAAYHQYWQQFETPFWEKEVSAGRINYTRSSLFLTQWLIAQTLVDVPAREVFGQFKRFVTDSELPVEDLLPTLHKSSELYKNFSDAASNPSGSLSRLELFVYRTLSMDSQVVRPILLWLVDPEKSEIPQVQLDKVLVTVESWLVRRTIVRASTNNYNKVIVDLLNELASHSRDDAGVIAEAFFARQTSVNSYWPGDEELKNELLTSPIYNRMARARLRMILEAIEDERRGWFTVSGKNPASEQPMIRGFCSIEHVIPQDWRANWDEDEVDEYGVHRDDLVHTLGNLVLLTQTLNSKVSNGPWLGENGKRESFIASATLLTTQDVINNGVSDWTANDVHERTTSLANDILRIWPVPAGHKGEIVGKREKTIYSIKVADLVNAGLISPGTVIRARVSSHFGREAQISEDGGIFVDGKRFETLSAAAKAVTGSSSEAGWWFWLVDPEGDRSFIDLRETYFESLQVASEFGSSESDELIEE